MILRACLGCGRPTPGSRCPSCAKSKPRSPSSQATSGAAHQRRRYRLRKQGPPWTCWLCGLPIESAADLAVDHVVPLSRGGADFDENTAPAHRSCNARRGAGAA